MVSLGGEGWGCPVGNRHECSLSSLRHRTSLPTFTAALEKERNKGRRWTSGWGSEGARLEEEEETGCVSMR